MALYLVTGGAGFIGTNIVLSLLKDGHTVSVLDNFSTGKRENIPAEAELFEADIRDADAIRPAFADVAGVFHTAAMARMPISFQNPRETNDVNITGTLNVLMAARDAGVKRVVYSSSSSIYGVQDRLPFSEDMHPHPTSPYGLQKYAAEEYVRLFAEYFDIEGVSLRYFNVCGGKFQLTEGMYALVIGKFLRLRKAGEPLTICGDGDYWRDFTYVGDVVAANRLAMETFTVGRGEAINIGGGNPRCVKEVAALIGGETVFIPPRPGDVRMSHADITKARDLLGWVPKVSLEEIIAELKQIHGI